VKTKKAHNRRVFVSPQTGVFEPPGAEGGAGEAGGKSGDRNGRMRLFTTDELLKLHPMN
jgi:hypothetical protein